MSTASTDSQNMLGVKQVAEMTSLPPATIRYYDQQFEEYLGVRRGPGRRRLFTPEAVARIEEVRRLLKDEGLSIRQARARLSGSSQTPVKESPPANEEVARLRTEVAELRSQVDQLRDIQVRTMALLEGLTKGG